MDRGIRHLAGQRLMLGFEGTRFNPDLETIIQTFQAGGIILFRQNIRSPDQVAALCADAQAFAASCGQPPLFIAVDQEGGVVSRLPKPFTQFGGNPCIRSRKEAQQFARITARELGKAGINMNLAPVMDVVAQKTDSIMQSRAFPGDAKAVAALGTMVIKTLQEGGIMAVAKHFPGIGRTVQDSHYHLPVLDADLAALEASDLIPFEAAVRADVTGIMLSHIICPRLDPQWQASLSVAIARDMIRNVLGFNGLVLTDDLDMKAVDHDMATCMARVLVSEIDLALICHQGPNIKQAFDTLVAMMGSDTTFQALGAASLERIYQYKEKYLAWDRRSKDRR
ncbi:MAG: beta-N-acetylhexosaminidase [Desulfotignum sp.]|nr:beta-N-acetylhexosaminidase [Desulfotignum sp.]MCF8112769.1 beta-N-acetylhexosaminidase [Desulfotignum sp.]MCF8125148.1 beta-N-acetylhexosaminidase [Desulfotignum sp.]